MGSGGGKQRGREDGGKIFIVPGGKGGAVATKASKLAKVPFLERRDITSEQRFGKFKLPCTPGSLSVSKLRVRSSRQADGGSYRTKFKSSYKPMHVIVLTVPRPDN